MKTYFYDNEVKIVKGTEKFIVYGIEHNGNIDIAERKVKTFTQRINRKLAGGYFNENIECEKYAKSIKEEINEKSKGMFADLFGFEYFQMVFYSPKENSCLYVIEILPDGERGEYFIYNALTHHKITSFRFPEQWEDYRNFLFEYSNGKIRL